MVPFVCPVNINALMFCGYLPEACESANRRWKQSRFHSLSYGILETVSIKVQILYS